jgi:hypothetical protein
MLKFLAAAALTMAAVSAHAQTSVAVEPQRLALAKQIFEAQGGAQNAEAVMRSMEKSMIDSAQTPQAKQLMADAMDVMGKEFLPHMFEDMAAFYAQDFTEGELKDILAFYSSPAGQALRAKQPMLAQQVGGTVARMIPRLQLRILEKVCSQTECAPQQQKQLSALKQALASSN